VRGEARCSVAWFWGGVSQLVLFFKAEREGDLAFKYEAMPTATRKTGRRAVNKCARSLGAEAVLKHAAYVLGRSGNARATDYYR